MTATLEDPLTEPGSSRLHRLRHHDVTVWVTMLIASGRQPRRVVRAVRRRARPGQGPARRPRVQHQRGDQLRDGGHLLAGLAAGVPQRLPRPGLRAGRHHRGRRQRSPACGSRAGSCSRAQVIYTIALLFAYWLFEQAMFEIGALCPWCLLVTLATTLVFFEMTYVNIRDDNLFLPRRVAGRAHRVRAVEPRPDAGGRMAAGPRAGRGVEVRRGHPGLSLDSPIPGYYAPPHGRARGVPTLKDAHLPSRRDPGPGDVPPSGVNTGPDLHG